MTKRIDHERPIHLACLALMRLRMPKATVWHTPNETDLKGSDIARAIAKQKMLGMMVGFPDLSALLNGRLLMVEVKAEKRRLSAAQEAARDSLLDNGAMWALVRSVDEMDAVINDFLALRPVMVRVPFRGIVA